ncbi:MAG: beta-lactamase family protein [Clostridia bacterium]|nr:beta-lactamase family protein [Clostridia bacterium]MBR2288437.1 beta-lactamase family protein [Clostridia bacterium]
MNFSALDRYLDTFYAEKNVPGLGCQVSVDGEIVHTHLAGFANVEERKPFTADTLINLYSATKVSTVTAGMCLVQKGLLDLDAPAGDYLPALSRVFVRDPDGTVHRARSTMLVRHLFSMSAGFTYDSDVPSVRMLRERTGNTASTREVVEALAEEPLAFEPGTRFRYSFCHDVLAAVMEAAAGKCFPEILREELFTPLGMHDTVFAVSGEQRSRLALEYYGFDGKTGSAREVIFREGLDMGMGPNYFSGGGGLMSTVNDYGKLAAMLGNGGRTSDGTVILSDESIRAMQENQQTAQGLEDFAEMGGWSKAGYGYGLGVRTLMDRERAGSLSQQGEFGWDGMLGCYVLADPASHVGIFYAQQENGTPWFHWHSMIRQYVYAAILGAET